MAKNTLRLVQTGPENSQAVDSTLKVYPGRLRSAQNNSDCFQPVKGPSSSLYRAQNTLKLFLTVLKQKFTLPNGTKYPRAVSSQIEVPSGRF